MGNPITIKGQLDRYGMGSLWNPQDPLLTQYEQIALTYKTNKTPADFEEFVIANLIARQVLYQHKSPGDCGSPSQASAGLGVNVAKFGSLGTSTAGVGIGLAGTTGAIAGATAAEAASIVGLAALPFTVIGLIGAHHAAAVAKEQAVLCSATLQANALFTSIDAAVANGSMSASQAIDALTQLARNADNFIAQVRQDCNAGCVITRAIKALVDLRVYLYKTAAQTGTALIGAGGGNSAVVQVASALTQSNTIAYGALAAVAAHFAGVF